LLKGTKLAAFLILSCVILLVAAAPLQVAQANPVNKPGGLTLAIIESPKDGRTYTTNTIPVSIITGDHQFPSTGYYSVDGGQEIKINEDARGQGTYKTTLNLADGEHTIHVRTETIGSACATSTFTIDTTHPFITLLSPENKVYNTSTVPLYFSLLNERLYNQNDVYQVTYNLDDKGIVWVPEGLTWYPLANLTNGQHNLVVYSQDAFGNGYSVQVKFEIKTPNPIFDDVTNSIIPLVIVSLITVLAVTSILVTYFKRQKFKAT
jgi:hypothetical protein